MTIELRSVTKTYGEKVTALDGVSASFAEGTFTAIMGPSGSGKSTLLHCAAGLDRPSAGEIIIDGVSLTGLSETGLTLLRRQRVGFVFQAFNLVSSLTAAQNVALPRHLAGNKPPAKEITSTLAQVGLASRESHYPSELSGGEQQRVALARALITRPAVLFADEPTGALDSKTSRGVMELLRDFPATVVMVTHDPVAASYADRVLLLSDGHMVDELAKSSADAIAAKMATMEASC
ncbi:ABC transporter ATP-binding protein [Catelliglobosispora koreensis]|uniref:ABC transporter ATP-binding protein n=1 Tax=Catelliglobosispora koreensis TaxID=129052 RepID=UPI000366E8E7|nr:ABC transporter ATP-binding protein [Catelliglobosispora koreensis]